MGMGSKAQTVGFEYRMGVHLALTHGPVDAVLELIGDDRTAWTGNVTTSSTITVNKPSLFGGKSSQGGWDGLVDIMMGEDTQGKNAYLVAKTDGPVPAYRGILSTVFRGYHNDGFMWSMMNPYFKSPVWRIYRAVKGWSRDVWYPEKAKIGTLDMNPAHIIYECLTDLEWGMGYSPADIDEVSFRACADKLYTENFGLSLLWMDEATINDFLQIIFNHIEGALRIDLTTGKFTMHLLRNDYVIADLPLLDEDNILQFSSFQRVAWGDTSNQIALTYTDREQKEATVTVQDLASIEAQGRVISATRSYIGAREPELAARLASRDLNETSSTLAKVTLTVNRVAWDWDIPDVFRLSWSRLGIVDAPFRIIKINKGNIDNGEITIDAVEDIFGLPASSYVDIQPPGWVNPVQEPAPVVAQRVIEAPYYDVAQAFTASDIAGFDEDFAFGELAAVQPSSATFGFELWAGANQASYTEIGTGDFSPTGTISADIPLSAGPLAITLTNASNISTDLIGEYAYIDNEAFQILGVVQVNALSPVITVARGVIDTIPAVHVAGTRMWFSYNHAGYDPTERVSGETVYYKALTRTGLGVLPIEQATAAPITFTGRAQRPYPPGNVQINGAYFPTEITGDLTVTWAHRDRLQQTAGFVPFTSGSIGPEAGTTYTVRLLKADGTFIRNYTGITGTSWTYPSSDVILDGNLATVRIQLFDTRDSKTSWQTYDMTVNRTDLVTTGFGLDFGNNFGGVH